MKNKRVWIMVVALLAYILLCFSACAVRDAFYCEHCHQTKVDIPHTITAGTVDTTVCTDCYESYQNGEWTFPK